MAVTSYVVYAACGAYGGRALLRAFGRGECFEAFVEERCLVPIKASARYRRKFGWGDGVGIGVYGFGWGGALCGRLVCVRLHIGCSRMLT